MSTWMLFVAGCRPRWCCNLHDKPITGIVPNKHTFGMAPGSAARIARTSIDLGIVIKLVIPDQVMESTVYKPVRRSRQSDHFRYRRHTHDPALEPAIRCWQRRIADLLCTSRPYPRMGMLSQHLHNPETLRHLI